MQRPMPLSSLPSVDRLLRSDTGQQLVAERGREHVTAVIRHVLAESRSELSAGLAPDVGEARLLERIRRALDASGRPSLRPVFNLTGTILHTNLGRAPLPAGAVQAMAGASVTPANVEFDLEQGRRGDRDTHVEPLLCRLTGAEAATV